MKIILFGATGGTGQQILVQALEQGHEVTAFVRSPGQLKVKHERLHVIKGALPEHPETAVDAIKGQDAVISALGRGNSFKASSLIQNSMKIIIPAMERHGVRRLIGVSAFGVSGVAAGEKPLFLKFLHGIMLKDIFADKRAAEEMLQHSGLEWTLACPVILTNGPKTQNYKAGAKLKLKSFPTISRADVADFVLKQLNDNTHIRAKVSLSS